MSFLVGLTGGIGSGKSTVAELFRQQGAAIIDSDAISHQLTASVGAAIEAIRESFGAGYLDASGALDRARMRKLVFADDGAKQRLEAILHPMIRERMLQQAQTAAPYALLVIPLLFETGNYLPLLQRVLAVDCPETAQVERAMRRNGLSEAEVRAIMARQLPRAERLARADDVINNDAGPEGLPPQVERLHRQYSALAAGNH